MLEVFEQLEVLSLDGDVQGSGGLVGDEDRWFAGNADGPDDALAHTAAQLVGVVPDAGFGGGDADLAEDVQHLLDHAAFGDVLVDFDGLAHLVADGKDRVKGGHGVLDNQGDPAAPDVAYFLFGHLEEVFAFEQDFPAHDVAGGFGDKPHEGEHGDGLTGARFAHDAQGFAAAEVERYTVDGFDGAPAGLEVGPETIYFQDHLSGISCGITGHNQRPKRFLGSSG